MIQKLIGLIIFLFGAYAIYSVTQTNKSTIIQKKLNTSEKLSLMLQQDLEQLKKENSLPGEFFNIKEVHFFSTSKLTQKWIKESPPKFKTKDRGSHKLEIVLIDTKSDKKNSDNTHDSIIIAQMSLIDLNSNNKVWELGRTFTFPNKEISHQEIPPDEPPNKAPNDKSSNQGQK